MNLTKPEKVGFSADRLTRINTHMQRYIDNGKISGAATLIARGDHVVHNQCQGSRNIEANLPITPETIFRIYSMTKPIASVALLMLYEEGHFQLSDPVSSLLPAFKETKVCVRPGWYEMELTAQAPEMTIQDLLRHTAGLSYGFYQDSPIDEQYRQTRMLSGEFDLEQMVDSIAALPLYYQPGTGWRYSVATDVVGRLVEVVSGQPLNEFLQIRIFEPLGMTDTGFWVPDGSVDRFASIYEAIGATTGVGVGLSESADASETATPHLRLVDPNEQSRFVRNRTMFSGGGGLVSTMGDYLQFAKMMLNQGELNGERLLGRKTHELMTINHVPEDLLPYQVGPEPAYGHGFGLGVTIVMDVAQSAELGSVGTYGWSGMANTNFWVDPVEEVIGILMTQLLPSSHHPIKREFKTLAYQAMVG